jgi:photosystem II stability/assembly factor-like uncharacterized protein
MLIVRVRRGAVRLAPRTSLALALALACTSGLALAACQHPIPKLIPSSAALGSPSSSLFWRDLNPSQSNTHGTSPNAASGGRVNGLASATDKSVMFAATEWGGLYRSTTVGRTWAHLPGHLPMATWQVAVDPSNPRKVYATSFYDGRLVSLAGVNVSADGGNTWVHPASAAPPAGFCDGSSRAENPSAFGIAIDRTQPRHVLVGTNCGLIASADAGATWRHIYPEKPGTAVDVWSIAIHGAGIIDICGELGHSRSTDGGRTWSRNPVVKLPPGRCSITASPRAPDHLIAALESTIYQSLDGGREWQPLDSLIRSPDLEAGRIASVAVNDRSGPNFDVWYGYGNLFRGTCTPSICPYGSLPGDTLDAWTEVGTSGGAHLDVGVVLFDPSASVDACPLLLSNDGGIEINAIATSPACQTPKWVQPDTTPHALWLLGMQLTSIIAFDSTVHDSAGRMGAVPISTPNRFHRLFFGTQDNGSFQSDRANGDTLWWDNTDPADAADVVGGRAVTINSVCCYPEKRLFVRRIGVAGIMFDTTARPLVLPPGTTALYSTGVIAHISADYFAVLTNHGLFVSHNITRDSTWTDLGWPPTIPKPSSGTLASLLIANGQEGPEFFVRIDSATAPSQLWRLDGVQLRDIEPSEHMPLDLERWRRVIPPNDSGGFGVVAVDRADASRIFASYMQPGRDPRMMHSLDGGRTWRFLPGLDACMTRHGLFRYRNARGPTGIGAGKNGFSGYAQPSLVAYGAPEDSGSVMIAGAADAGVFVSFDHGERWSAVSDPVTPQLSDLPHIPRPRFARAERDPLTTTVYVGTQGRGVWSLRFPNPASRGAVFPPC